MWRAWNSDCRENDKPVASFSKFKKIFYRRFNFNPRRDVCSFCEKTRIEIKTEKVKLKKQELITQFRLHKLRAKRFNSLMKEKQDDNIAVCFDVQQNQHLAKPSVAGDGGTHKLNRLHQRYTAGRLIIVLDEAQDRGVTSKLDQLDEGVAGGAVIGVQRGPGRKSRVTCTQLSVDEERCVNGASTQLQWRVAWVQVERAGSPVPSCLSMKSDASMGPVPNFSGELPGDSRVRVERAGSPVPSCLSMKSDASMGPVPNFSGELPGDSRVQVERAGSPVPSCLSMKSDASMGPVPNFSGELPGDSRVRVERAGSPVPSCLSMKSDASMGPVPNFSGELPGDSRVQVERAGSPVPSCLSMKSDASMGPVPNFSGELPGDSRVRVERAGSPVPSCLSMKSDASMGPVPNFSGELLGDSSIEALLELRCLEEKKLFFPKQSFLCTLMKLKKDEKLKLFQSHLSQYYPECRETEQEDPEALFIVEKMLETCGSERSLKITHHILRNMKQKDLTASLERDEQHSKSFLSLLLCVH
ncbi:hypothetical protein SKAU_G00115630 [Synaphobranchus kaupii]|uniref:Pyrin domain-containing protein n=1 Tax=Synaphobranchus kaupii TaxID=118154 RepID=A0A9Q1IZR0_SYNKA|nr:hypothetical protein SKAU_G00115630 [Synaphobranchus kaupii]